MTRIVDNLMELRSSQDTDDFRYLDPKLVRQSESLNTRSKQPFQEAVVFMVGGGNYMEYQNLVDYAKVSFNSFLCIIYPNVSSCGGGVKIKLRNSFDSRS